MQQVSYCGTCNLYSSGQGFMCNSCGNQVTILLNPDNNQGFLVDMSNDGHAYFHDIADFRFKEKVIQKLLKMSFEKKHNIDYIN